MHTSDQRAPAKRSARLALARRRLWSYLRAVAMRPHPLTLLLLIATVAGFSFAAVSTYDFTAHLDRQVHGIHCSFFPGMSAAETGNSGCHVTLMSPYSSVMRDSVWGGIPIALPAMSVFSFLAFWALWLALRNREQDRRAALFTLAATLLPAASSAVMAYISFTQLHAACKLCIGIYASSGVAFIAALMLWLRSGTPVPAEQPASEPLAWGGLGLSFCLGVLFVVLPVSTYAMSAPDFESYIGTCGELAHAGDAQTLVPLGPQDQSTAMIEVLDPLCPSCRGFEARYSIMPVATKISRKALLFPLDNTCNWMVGETIHPGACTLSEAVLCAGDQADKVLAWSYANQEAIVAASKADPKAAARMVSSQFPDLARCVGSAAVRARLNLVLRLAVKNKLQVLTPQVFVEGLRMCDEDTDLGLDYALPRLIERARTAPVRPAPREPAPPLALPPMIHRPTPSPTAAPRAQAPVEPSEPVGPDEPPAPEAPPPPEPPPAPEEPPVPSAPTDEGTQP